MLKYSDIYVTSKMNDYPTQKKILVQYEKLHIEGTW